MPSKESSARGYLGGELRKHLQGGDGEKGKKGLLSSVVAATSDLGAQGSSTTQESEVSYQLVTAGELECHFPGQRGNISQKHLSQAIAFSQWDHCG